MTPFTAHYKLLDCWASKEFGEGFWITIKVPYTWNNDFMDKLKGNSISIFICLQKNNMLLPK